MESFLKTVKSETYALNGWDFISGFANIPFTYYYKNTDASPDFMPADRLRAAFFRTLQEFPILAGRLVVNSQSRAFVVVDRDNLNLPEYIESESPIHYSFAERAQFNPGALPISACIVGPSPTASADGQLKLLNVHIIRLRDNSGLVLFANMPHYVCDGFGYSAFMRRWAEVCALMHNGAESVPFCNYAFDRAILDRAMPEQMQPLDNACRRVYSTRRVLGRFLSWLSPEARGRLLVEGCKRMPASAHIFHISKQRVAELRCRIADESPLRRISDNDVLTAMISQAVGAAACAASENMGFVESALRLARRPFLARDEFMSLVIVDIRPRLKQLEQLTPYVGGCITGIPVFSSLRRMSQAGFAGDKYGDKDGNKLDASVLADACAGVRQMVDGLTDTFVSGIDYAINRDPTCYAHSLALALTTPEKVIITNQTRFSLYDCDFGCGAPQWVCPPPTFLTNFASILPASPNSDGYKVYLSVDAHIMPNILANKLWSANTSLVY
ncbi:hypothetical protein IWW55_002818 [Coemansia sp. RSA 2706]|nr:hypothetical protein IWW55_002818 [Coemansia sp. RSA 2706]KAJ2312121.1 hypothetical protein IWW54_002273 [Coemansia sp. RSA 2705]